MSLGSMSLGSMSLGSMSGAIVGVGGMRRTIAGVSSGVPRVSTGTVFSGASRFSEELSALEIGAEGDWERVGSLFSLSFSSSRLTFWPDGLSLFAAKVSVEGGFSRLFRWIIIKPNNEAVLANIKIPIANPTVLCFLARRRSYNRLVWA